jgi:hypothetical protein
MSIVKVNLPKADSRNYDKSQLVLFLLGWRGNQSPAPKNDVPTENAINENTWTSLQPTTAYELNIHFVLGLQQCGDEEADSAVHAGVLDLALSPFKRTWQKVERSVRNRSRKEDCRTNIKLEV